MANNQSDADYKKVPYYSINEEDVDAEVQEAAEEKAFFKQVPRTQTSASESTKKRMKEQIIAQQENAEIQPFNVDYVESDDDENQPPLNRPTKDEEYLEMPGEGDQWEKESARMSARIKEFEDLGIEIPLPPQRKAFTPELTRYRWLMLFLLAGNILMQSSLCLSLAPVAVLIGQAYKVSLFEVDMCSIIFSLTYTIFTFVAMPLYTKIGFTSTIRIACLVFLSGCWCRSLNMVVDEFWPILLGSIWLSCAYPFFLSAPGLLAQAWFPDYQTAIATTVCGLALPCGNIVAFTMTGCTFLGIGMPADPETITNEAEWNTFISETKDATNKLLIEQNIIISILCIGMFICVRSKPDKPPSLAALQEAKEKDFKAGFLAAIKDKNFVLLMISYCFVDGSFISFGSILSGIFTPLGFNTAQITIIGLITVIAGVASSMGTGIMLQKTHKYKIALMISCWGTAAFLIASVFTFPSRDMALVLPNVLLVGLFIVPVIPISMNFSQEITFPMEQTVVTGVLMMLGQFSGFCLSIISSFIVVEHSAYALFFFGCCCVISGICSIIMKEDLKRLEYTNNKLSKNATRLDEIAIQETAAKTEGENI